MKQRARTTAREFGKNAEIVNCQERRELLLLYAADALDAVDASEMRQHLQAGCPECLGYLAEAQAVVASIPLGLDPIVPPDHLKQKLMNRIDAEEAERPATSHEIAGDDDAVQASPFRLIRYFIPAAVAAGLAIVCTYLLTMRGVDRLQQQNNDLLVQASNAQAEVRELRQLRGQFQSQTHVVEMLQSEDVKLIPLKPTALQPHAVANLLWDQKNQQWAVLTTGMTPPGAGQTYELWFITKSDSKIAAGTFNVDANGKGSLLVPIPPGIGDLKVAAVTNEKAGGARQPQGSVQVAGNVE